MSLRKLAFSNKAAIERSRSTTPPKVALRVQAVEGYVLYCLAYMQAAATAEKIVGSAGFSLTKYRILGLATLTPGITIGELVNRLRITHQGVNAPLRQLIEEGHVVAKIGAEDRRHKQLFATRKGSRLYVQILSANVANVEKAFRAAGPEAVRGFLEIHRRLVDAGDREWAERASHFVEKS
jgi:DNA-binding MarR family transcriptional regulator